jgi:HlyD family secretion protein
MIKALDTDGSLTSIESADLQVNDEVIISQRSENGN